MRNRLRNFRIRDSLLLKALNHSYIRKRYSYFVSSMSPHPIFTGWQLNRQAAWSAISRYIYLPQFSQTCHNYNVFDNRDVCVCVCVCLFCVILFKQSELSGCMGCVNMLVTGRMCVWWASYSTSATVCKLPSGEHSRLLWKKKKWEKCLVCKCCVLETVGDSELWSKPGKLRQEFFFDSSSCVVWTKTIFQLKGRAWLDVRVDVFNRCTKIHFSQWNRSVGNKTTKTACWNFVCYKHVKYRGRPSENVDLAKTKSAWLP